MFELPQPVLAGLEAVVQAIILLVILASGAAKMFRESKEAQRQAERQRQRQQRRPDPEIERQAGGEVAQARVGDPARQPPQEAIRSEVEEFLRRVGQQDEAEPAPPRPRPQRQPRIEVLDGGSGFDVDEEPRQRRTQRRPERPRPRPTKPTASATRRPEGIARGETVAEHVSEHLRRGEFEERASHLGEEVSQSDERLEARLHEKFDHGLGSLTARRIAREAADSKQKQEIQPSQADYLLDALSSPQGVQQAIIMAEVLNRPADRW